MLWPKKGSGAVEQPQEYRPNPNKGWFFVVVANFMLMLGLSVGFSTRPDSAMGCFCVTPFALLNRDAWHCRYRESRVEIGPSGIVMRGFLSGFTRSWETIDFWAVVNLRDTDDADLFNAQAVQFVCGSQKWHIKESEVARPGFDLFVENVRYWAEDRERIVFGDRPNSTS